MITFDARYFDGRTSGALDVKVGVTAEGNIRIEGDGVEKNLRRDEVRISARLGNSPRYLYLPDGAKCESIEHDAMDSAFADRGGLVHGMERRWTLVVAAAVFTIAFLWAGLTYVVPIMARHAAYAVPIELEQQMGERSLAALDEHFLEATELTQAARARARAAFDVVAGSVATELPISLELRRSEVLGANALALPSGIIVITDAMVELADNDQQLMAVICHEIGHVHHRHIMRSILQNSVVALLVATLLGDVASVTGLAASIPTFLVEQRYSREFEFEADRFAQAWMRAEDIETDHLADILSRLTDEAGGDSTGFERYLSTHPSTEERIEAIRKQAHSG